MGDTTIYISARPEDVFARLTKPIDDVEPGPLKVGNHWRVPGRTEVYTVTLVEPPSRFGYSVLTHDVTTSAEYTILPQGAGSQVRVEMDQQAPTHPLSAMIIGGFLEGRTERKMLEDLKSMVETK
jgi:Polyketide cyclase / dehydrase and lipid transport